MLLAQNQIFYNLLENMLLFMKNHCKIFEYKTNILCSMYFIYTYLDDKNSKPKVILVYVDRNI